MQSPAFEGNSLSAFLEACWYLIPCIVLGVVIGQLIAYLKVFPMDVESVQIAAASLGGVIVGSIVALLVLMYFDR